VHGLHTDVARCLLEPPVQGDQWTRSSLLSPRWLLLLILVQSHSLTKHQSIHTRVELFTFPDNKQLL